MTRYERFDAWRLCHELTLEIYRVTRTFPADERFGLVSQSRRAAFSAAANIAEGSAKRGPKEFRRYLDISIGSLSELGYAIRLAIDLDYVPHTSREKLGKLHTDASKTTWALYASMGRR